MRLRLRRFRASPAADRFGKEAQSAVRAVWLRQTGISPLIRVKQLDAAVAKRWPARRLSAWSETGGPWTGPNFRTLDVTEGVASMRQRTYDIRSVGVVALPYCGVHFGKVSGCETLALKAELD